MNPFTEHATEEKYHERSRKKWIAITLLSFLLLVLVVSISAGMLIPRRRESADLEAQISTDHAIVYICSVTQYPESCNWSLSSMYQTFNRSNSKPFAINDIVKLSMQVSLSELINLYTNLISDKQFNISDNENPALEKVLNNCKILIEDAVEYLRISISSTPTELSLTTEINDIRTWLSSAITSQEACADGIVESTNKSTLLHNFTNSIRYSKEFTSNSLAIVSNILTLDPLLQIPKRNLFKTTNPNPNPSVPRMISSSTNPKPDLVVAKDGSGDYKTICEAVAAIPKTSMKRFTIYIKRGVYIENVELNRDLWNVLMYGDGMFATVVSGSLNSKDNTPTYSTATFGN